MIDVNEAVRIAQEAFGTSEHPGGIAKNNEVYVIGYNTAFNMATMTSSWAVIDKQTGDYELIGGALMHKLAPTLWSIQD